MAQIIIFTGTAAFVNTRAIGAYQIANVLRNSGYTVQVIDHFPLMVKEEGITLIKKVLEKFIDKDTLWIGLSGTFFLPDMFTYVEPTKRPGAMGATLDSSIILSKQEKIELKDFVKNINPSIKWVVGGSRAHIYNGGSHLVDCYIEGYADATVVEYTKFLEGKNPFLKYRVNSNGTMSIVHDKKGSLFDFSNHVFSWHESDYINSREALPIEISRGCIFKCKFCAYPLNGRKKFDYIKNPKILYNELLSNYEKYGTTNYVFLDDTYNDSPYKVELLYNEVFSKLPFKINWGAYLRLDLLAAHPHTIEILKKSGIRIAFFGIESLNYNSNKAVGKGIKPEKILETLKLIKSYWKDDVTMQGGFIIGLPHDSEETVRDWLNTASHPDYPLDAIVLTVLQLWPKAKKDLDVAWVSDIELDPEKYGYTFEGTDRIMWKNNKGLTKKKASLILDEFKEIQYNNKKDSWGWGLAFGLLNLGYPDITEVQKHQAMEMVSNRDFFYKQSLSVLDEYLNKIFKEE